MKKSSLFLIPTLVASMVSCANQDEVDSLTSVGNEVAIAANVNKASRNNYVSNLTFPTTFDMNLFAIAVDSKGNATEFCNDQLFKYDESSAYTCWRWYDGTDFVKKYLPREGYINWIGYSTTKPHADAVATKSANGLKFESIDLDFHGTSIIDEDVLVTAAYNQSNMTQTSGQKTNLQFKHAMANIRFEISAPAALGVTVKSIKISNLYNTGKLTFGSTDIVTSTINWDFSAETPGEIVYPVPGDPSTYVHPADPSDAMHTPTFFGNGHLLIPAQRLSDASLGDTPAEVTVVYTIDGVDYSRTIALPAGSLKEGNLYTYQITIKVTELSVTGRVSEWSNNDNPITNF